MLIPFSDSTILWRAMFVLGILSAASAAVWDSGSGSGNASECRNSLHHGRRQSSAPGVMGVNITAFSQNPNQLPTLPLKRIDHRGVVTPSIAKRLFKTDLLAVYGAAYMAEMAIGADKQVVDVLIDTGSFELWVNPDCKSSNVAEFCNGFGHYNPLTSKTSKKGNQGFSIAYGSGKASGLYYKDDIYISGGKIQAQQFGVANSSDKVWFGVMGLGHSGAKDYPFIVDSLAAQGLINTKFFSIDLGGQIKPGAAITGEMVFGGVDINKYSGFLQKVPTDPSDPHYKVVLNSLLHRAPGSKTSRPFLDKDLPLSVIVDSGTTLSLLPESIVSQLAAQFPGAKPDGSGGYIVDCAFQRQAGSVDFEFIAGPGKVTINVAYKDFIWNSGGDCFLGAWHSNDLGVWILGDTFLRGAYVSFDQTNNALFMSNYVSCNGGNSNLVAVLQGPNAAGNIRGACAPLNPISSTTTTSAQTTTTRLPSGTVRGSVIPSAESSLGQSLNPVRPATTTRKKKSSSSARKSTRKSSRTSHKSPSTTRRPSPSHTSNTIARPSSRPKIANSAAPTPTTVHLKKPTNIPQGGSDGGPARGRPSVGVVGVGEDPDLIVTEPTTTITKTVTRAVIYTETACSPDEEGCAAPPGKVATRYETSITTYCPEDRNVVTVTTISATTVTAAVPVITVTIETSQHQAQSQAQAQGGEEEIAVAVTTPHLATTAFPTTTVYEITACDADEVTCTIGVTTTRVVTVTAIVEVVPVPASPSTSKSASATNIFPSSSAASNASLSGNGNNIALGNATRSGSGVGAGGPSPVLVAGAAVLKGGFLGLVLTIFWSFALAVFWL